MKKEIRIVKKGIVQVTTVDERWYVKESMDGETGLPTHDYWPSVTWISSYYPKGIEMLKWLASKGWDEAESIKIAAGDSGSKVHYAIESLLSGNEVAMGDKFINPTTDGPEELTVDEYKCVLDFHNWFKKNPDIEILGKEVTYFNAKHKYAGTIDLIYRSNGQIYVVDIKTSKSVWTPYRLQISAYGHLDVPLEELGIKNREWEEKRLAILQVGYKRNRDGYKFTTVDDQFDLFLAIKRVWENECKKISPPQIELPLKIKIEKIIKKVEEKVNKQKHDVIRKVKSIKR